MQGTPTVLVFDRQGRLRRHYLGAVDDVRLGAEIMALCIEDKKAPREASMAIEMKLHAALVDPQQHEHAADGSCCGGHGHSHDHDHGHDHAHAHDHAHDHERRLLRRQARSRPQPRGARPRPRRRLRLQALSSGCHPELARLGERLSGSQGRDARSLSCWGFAASSARSRISARIALALPG